MAKITLRNLFLSVIQKRFLQTNVVIPSSLKAVVSLTKSSSVLNCLKSHGFEDTQIAKLLKKRPDILNCKVNAKLKPKLQYLIQNGFSGKLLPELILSNPMLLFRSLESQIKPSFDFLRPILNDDQMLAAIKRSSWLLTYNVNTILRPNVDLLISEGIPANRISKLLILQPRVILQSHDRMVYAVNAVKEIGLEPKNPMFIHALRVICSMSELNWKKKLEVYTSLGWSREEVLNTFRKDPLCLACSEKKLRYLMDFYLNTMKLDTKTIIGYPKLLLYAADKRVRARYTVMKVLVAKKLIKEKVKIVWVITMPEKKFLEEYITQHKDKVPGLLDLYRGTVKRRKTIGGKKDTLNLKSASLTL